MRAADLKLDIKSNANEIETLAKTESAPGILMLTTPGELALARHLQHTLWPCLDGLCDQLKEHEDALEEAVEVIGELEEAIDDLTEDRGSILTPDDAGPFALVVELSRAMVANLKQGKTPTADELVAIELACNAAEKKIQDVTINVDIDGDADDEEDEDDDDDE